MKQITLFTCLATVLLWSCKKIDGSYTVICEFESSNAARWLVVTDDRGKVLGSEEIAKGSSSFRGNFSIAYKDSPDSFDVHLVTQNLNSGSYWVYSYIGVYNGSALFIDPDLPPYLEPRPFLLIVKDVASISEIDVFDSIENWWYSFNSGNAIASFSLKVRDREGLVLRLEANGEQKLRSLYLSDTTIANRDSLVVTWEDFKPESDIREVTLKGEENPSIVFVEAVSPDFKHFVCLFGENGTFHSMTQKFNRPEALPATWLYRISGYQDQVWFDRMFQPTEVLKMEKLDVKIDKITRSGNTLSLVTEGQFDIARISSGVLKNVSGTDRHFYWQLNGRPHSFANYQIPDLKTFFPDWVDASEIFKEGLIRVADYDLYNYEQLQSGFPDRLNDRYAFAKSGYRELWINY
ncbi:MAG: hypothetical protein ACKVU0_17795 [Saprospiraceae bacterium]